MHPRFGQRRIRDKAGRHGVGDGLAVSVIGERVDYLPLRPFRRAGRWWWRWSLHLQAGPPEHTGSAQRSCRVPVLVRGDVRPSIAGPHVADHLNGPGICGVETAGRPKVAMVAQPQVGLARRDRLPRRFIGRMMGHHTNAPARFVSGRLVRGVGQYGRAAVVTVFHGANVCQS
jgi:hypothetical protein